MLHDLIDLTITRLIVLMPKVICCRK